MSWTTKALIPAVAIGSGVLGFVFVQERISVLFFAICVALALSSVIRYVVNINGHDPWRDLRREHRRHRARRR